LLANPPNRFSIKEKKSDESPILDLSSKELGRKYQPFEIEYKPTINKGITEDNNKIIATLNFLLINMKTMAVINRKMDSNLANVNSIVIIDK
jgi:hypothetical protein